MQDPNKQEDVVSTEELSEDELQQTAGGGPIRLSDLTSAEGGRRPTNWEPPIPW